MLNHKIDHFILYKKYMKNKYILHFKNLLYDKQFIKYTLIGLVGVSIDFILFTLLVELTPVNFLIANFIAISIAISNNFLLNTFFNFKKTNQLFKRFIIFYFVGFLGLLVSQLLLGTLVGLGLGELIAKALTLPFILLFQFILNRKFSFNDEVLILHKFKLFLKKHFLIIGIIIMFTVMSLAIIKSLPLSSPLGGPDEATHYGYNVEYIIKNKKLPVSGKDDIKAYQNCREDLSNYVTCTYSYQPYIGANYFLYAIFSSIIHTITDLSYLKAARLLSLVYGIIYITFIYLAALKVTKRPNISAAITAIVSLLPQVIFVFSYINQDAHSLAIASFAIWCFVSLWKNPNSKFFLVMTAVAVGGLLPLVKYSYFLFIPIAILFVAFLYFKRKLNNKQILRLVAYGLISFLLLSSFWYIRNYLLYSDFLGQNYMINEMSKYHTLGNRYPLLSVSTLSQYANLNFFNILFNSFFFAFGYMYYYLNQAVYYIVGAVLTGALVLSVKNALDGPKKYTKSSLVIIALFIIYLLMAIFLVYYNSINYDFQPQGRYLYSVLPFFATALATLYSLNRRYTNIIYIFIALVLFLLFGALDVFVRFYI